MLKVQVQQRLVTSDRNIPQQLQPCKQLWVSCEALTLVQSGWLCWLCQQPRLCT